MVGCAHVEHALRADEFLRALDRVAQRGAELRRAGLGLLQQAAAQSLKKAKPGTAEFRTALRDAIEGTKEFVGSQGVFNMSPADHNGVDQRSQVMVRIEGGTWKLQN